MPIRQILRIGHPTLLAPAEKVTEFNTDELDLLVNDMLDTMKAADGAGLAANQIGVLKRVVIFGFDENSRYPEHGDICPDGSVSMLREGGAKPAEGTELSPSKCIFCLMCMSRVRYVTGSVLTVRPLKSPIKARIYLRFWI